MAIVSLLIGKYLAQTREICTERLGAIAPKRRTRRFCPALMLLNAIHHKGIEAILRELRKSDHLSIAGIYEEDICEGVSATTIKRVLAR